jgi:hypothetical protein
VVVTADDPIVIESPTCLVRGSAFSADRVDGMLDRVVARAIGGATRQTRWLARTRPSGWAMFEHVAFG